MKILIAPLHYVISSDTGSEFTRAYQYLSELAKDKKNSGDVLVGYSPVQKIGNFKIHSFWSAAPHFISIITRLKFILWVTTKGLALMSHESYDGIWHQGPFAIGETFSLLALLRPKYIHFVVGPIYTPHIAQAKSTANYSEKNKDGQFVRPSFIHLIDIIMYQHFAKLMKYISHFTLAHVNQVVTIDDVGKKMLVDDGISNVTTIPLTIPTEKFIRKSNSVPTKICNILNVSYLIERKRTQDLLQALSIIYKNKSSVKYHLTIVGDGPEKQKLVTMANELGIKDYVQFVGQVPHTLIHTFYLHADLFWSASISDIMPGMYFEAMASGIPIVIAKNITASQLYKDNFGGIVVDHFSPEQIALATQKIVQNQHLYAKMCQNNLKLMQTKYNFKHNIEKLASLLRGDFI